MNRVKKGGVMAVVLLVMGLVSCEKEALNGEATIHFMLSDSAYGSDEVRSAGHVRMEPETVVVPVKGELHVYATLEEDAESPLRAPGDATLDVGTRVLIVVYNSADDAYVNSFEYEVTNAGGAIEPVGNTSGLTLTTGNYKFVAYSFNTTSVPGYAASITDGAPYSPNANASDPLWGISGPHSITAGGSYNISIAMKHQFSRVALKATTDGMDAPVPTISDMEAVLLGYKATAMTALTGALTKGTAEEQTITFPTFSASTTVTSDACMVYAGGESTTSIKITSATIGGTTGSVPTPIRFNKQLEPGKSYTLRVSFKMLLWARSNIYWDTGAETLTFVPAGTDGSKEGYQGVFFRWGSLVGVSPALVNGEKSYTGQSVPIYVPIVRDNLSTSTWKATTSTAVMADVNAAYGFTVVSDNYSTWDEPSSAMSAPPTDIPYLDGSYDASANHTITSTFVMDEVRNTLAVYKGFRGDICQYLSQTGAVPKGYRMPMAYEFGAQDGAIVGLYGWAYGGLGLGNNDALANEYGTGDLINYTNPNLGIAYAANSILGIRLPASALRSSSTGYLSTVGYTIYCWTGSAYNAIGARLFRMTTGTIELVYANRARGLPVRCVKN